VRDVEDGQPVLFLQLGEKIQDVEPDRDVQHRDRLIREQNARADGQSARNSHALSLTAGELMRVFAQKVFGGRQADAFQKRQRLVADVFPAPGMPVHAQGAAEMIADVVDRVKRREGVLEDQLDMAAILA
jgi:hypothetical protein